MAVSVLTAFDARLGSRKVLEDKERSRGESVWLILYYQYILFEAQSWVRSKGLCTPLLIHHHVMFTSPRTHVHQIG
jgi:hypothetical protein